MINELNINSLLWRVSRADILKPSYIFGTHHIAPMSVCEQIPGFQEAFASTEQMFAEVELSQMEDAAGAEYMTKKMRLPLGNTLSELFSPYEYHLISEAVRRYVGVDVCTLENLKPSVVYSRLNLYQALEQMEELGEDNEQRLDVLLQEKALEQGKELYGLENVQVQADYLFDSPLEDQVCELLDYISLGEEASGYIKEVTEFYMRQDISAIAELMENNAHSGMSDRQLERLVYQRNQKWAAVLSQEFMKLPTFVAVGAGHLPGERGLLELLCSAGYIVEPLV